MSGGGGSSKSGVGNEIRIVGREWTDPNLNDEVAKIVTGEGERGRRRRERGEMRGRERIIGMARHGGRENAGRGESNSINDDG